MRWDATNAKKLIFPCAVSVIGCGAMEKWQEVDEKYKNIVDFLARIFKLIKIDKVSLTCACCTSTHRPV